MKRILITLFISTGAIALNAQTLCANTQNGLFALSCGMADRPGYHYEYTAYKGQRKNDFGKYVAYGGGAVTLVALGVIVANWDDKSEPYNSKLSNRQYDNWAAIGVGGFLTVFVGYVTDKIINSPWLTVVEKKNEIGIAYNFERRK